ncbi:chemotaxis protein CheB [Botrimarina sp.]|uniref:CheR family methyltransferase n=1 Tax=Botrimarina sp. TaxID=2795802 RepID=UPI0032EE1935
MADKEPGYVVGIGASAGGLQSLERFFDRLDEKTGAAFIVIQHLSPNYETMMDKLLARRTMMPVSIAKDGQSMEPDHVYVIPPRRDLTVDGAALRLSEQEADELPHLPIDRLFKSIAEQHGERSIGIVLSGTGSDGSEGVRQIRRSGGLVLCESEATAKFSGMPHSAQATGCVDHVLPSENMGPIIARRILGPGSQTERGDEMERIFTLLRDRLQVDFSQYKSATVSRRVDRRMALARVESLADYVRLLESDPSHIDQLYLDMLIGVTRFFRDPPCFQYFEREVAPQLLERADPETGLRVWVAGCATGEEAFSLAMVLHEQNRERAAPVPIKVFASDIHHDSLRRASAATYDDATLQNVSADRLERHFEARDGQHRLRKHIRQLVVFAPHNLLHDPPFTSLDMVSCRNLLIYFDTAAQNRVLTLFHFGLKQNGVLFLGPSETVGELDREFQSVHDKFRFYRKIRDARLPDDVTLPVTLRANAARPAAIAPPPGAVASPKHDLYDALLDGVLPPTLLIDSERRVVEMYGGADRFLRLRGRKVSTDLLDLCPEPLQGVLSVGVRRAIAGGGEHVRLPDTTIPTSAGGQQRVAITLTPVRPSRGGGQYLALSFYPAEATDRPTVSEEDRRGALLQFSSESGELGRRVRELEDELTAAQEDLQSTIEELEASNEELQATNEELVSSNEGLQSSNEELNSVNEELHTVNVEFQSKNSELHALNVDMNHLLASTDIATIFLDRALAIRRFTPGATKLFHLEPQDLGRPLLAFSHNLCIERLDALLAGVLDTGEPHQSEVTDTAGTHYFLRVLPFEIDGELSGVTVTLTDIQALVEARTRAEKFQDRLQRAIDAVPVLVSFVNRKRCYAYANRAYSQLFGIPTDEMIGMPVREVLGAEAYAKSEPRIDRALAGEPQQFESFIGPAGSELSVIVNYRPERNSDGEVIGFYVSASDITTLKQTERELEAAVEAARTANEAKSDFLAKMSHEIRSPMAAILGFADLLKGQLKEPDNQNCIEIIRSNGEHLLSLINDLLDLSQIELRRVEIAKEPVDVRAVLSDSFNTLRPRAATNRVELQARLRDSLVDGMLTDSRRLKQIVVNLLTNAVKFGQGGRATLSGRRTARRRELVVTVADTGHGIAAEDLARLFEPFSQIDSTSSRAHEGSGLGLAIAKQLVEEMDGRLRVRSRPGVGSAFQFRLPWREALAPVEGAGVAELRDDLPRLDGRKLLVVDDRRDMRFIAEHILADVGAEVTTVGSGEEALAEVERSLADGAGYACVVTDIQMPGMDGYAVARELRRRRFESPILALTANAMPSDRQKCYDAGCSGYISKPIDRAEFIRVVAEATSNGSG